MAWSWDFMLQVFRSLGGEAENIARKTGSGGSGIVPVDSEKEVLLRAPANLIFPISDVEFLDGQLRIKDNAPIEKAERTFFENYYSAFSWQGGGDVQASAFLSELEKLPTDVLTLLLQGFGLEEVLAGESERAERWFLDSRMFVWRGAAVLVPVLEMVNHAADARRSGDEKGLSVGGQFPGEVVMLRNRLDPFRTFLRLGVASPEARAFSLPMNITPEGGGEIEIAQNINTNSSLGSAIVPAFKREGDVLWISYLMIGNYTRPKLPRSIYYRVMSDAGRTDGDQTFDFILHRNRLAFLKLLETLENHEGSLISTLRKVVRFQLEAMSWCIGHRALK